jgi:hypothetical protein
MRHLRGIAVLIALAACADVTGSSTDPLRKRKDAGMSIDAVVHVDAPADSPLATSVACFTEGEPGATCTLPSHCCFNNYSSFHDGFCATSACTWGTETCDGPEDCGAGQRCCSRAMVDASGEITGYKIACSADPCGVAPLDYEVCHPATGCSSGTCVTTVGNDNDLPPELYICR